MLLFFAEPWLWSHFLDLFFQIFAKVDKHSATFIQDYRARTDRWCALLCTATNIKLLAFLFWTATKTNYISTCSDFQKKLIDTITTSNFYLKFKETIKMTWLHKFFRLFLFQPTAETNRPNSWFWRCCHSTPYIFHAIEYADLWPEM